MEFKKIKTRLIKCKLNLYEAQWHSLKTKNQDEIKKCDLNLKKAEKDLLEFNYGKFL